MKMTVFILCFCAAVSAQAQPADTAAAQAAAVSTVPVVGLTWDHPPEELYVNGGKKFNYKGRTYVLKLGFLRGAYESFVKNYKSMPVFMLTDITDGIENYKVWNAGLLESNQPFKINTGSMLLSVVLRQNEVAVYRYSKKEKPGKKIATLSYKELRAAWEENAARYKVDLNGKPAYFVPQAFYNQSGCNSVGYVASAPEPYFADTGLPLDFVELYRYTKASTDRRRLAYSVPLGVSFNLSEDNGKKWILNAIKVESLYEAMDDEADRPEDCNSGLRDPMKKAEGGK